MECDRCGFYIAHESTLLLGLSNSTSELTNNDRAKISGWLREKSIYYKSLSPNTQVPGITTLHYPFDGCTTINDILRMPPNSPIQCLERALINLSIIADTTDEIITLTQNDYPVVYARDLSGLKFRLQDMVEKQWIRFLYKQEVFYSVRSEVRSFEKLYPVTVTVSGKEKAIELIKSMNNPKPIRTIQNELLSELWHLSDATSMKRVERGKLESLRDIESNRLGTVIRPLGPNGKNLIGYDHQNNLDFWLTDAGVDAVENPSSVEQTPTPSITNYAIDMSNSTQATVQQGSHGSTQRVKNTSTVTNPDLGPLIEKLLAELPQQTLSDDDKDEIETLLRTLKQQGKKTEPNTSLMAEAAKSLRNIAEGVVGNMLEPGFVSLVHQTANSLLH